MAAGRDVNVRFCRHGGTASIDFDGGTGRYTDIYMYIYSRRDGTAIIMLHDDVEINPLCEE